MSHQSCFEMHGEMMLVEKAGEKQPRTMLKTIVFMDMHLQSRL